MSWTIPSDSTKHPCIAVAFAIACEAPLHDFLERLKNRGGPVKGTYHTQQCTDVARDLGYATMWIESQSMLVPSADYQGEPAKILYPEGNTVRFMNYLRTHTGVLGGMRPNMGHAVAWDGTQIYDPRGYIYDYYAATNKPHRFYVNNFAALVKVRQG